MSKKQPYPELFKRKKLKPHEKFIVFDIESNNWKDFVIGGIYDGENFYTETEARHLLFKILKYGKVTVYSHFGGIFDHLFIFDALSSFGAIPSNIIMRGSSLFSFDIGYTTFVDSSGILPFSLEKAANAFQVEHRKLKIDHSKIKTVTPKLIRYLEHDCKALYETIKKFKASEIFKETNPSQTLAGLALEVLRKTLTKPIPSLNDGIDSIIRQAYAGGRVEIFKPYYNNKKAPIHYYDFNSLYPSVMQKMDVPGQIENYSKTLHPMGFSKIKVKIKRDTYLPILWKKQNLKFYFPVGEFEGIFPCIEIMEAINQGQVEKLKIEKTYIFENLGQQLNQYVTDLYTIRQNSPDPVNNTIAKLLLNSAYGRLAIKRDRETLVFDEGQENITPIDVYLPGKQRLAKIKQTYRGFSNCAIGAMVTAHARLKLQKKMREIESEIFYCDTDSIVTTAKLETSQDLGELKLEDTENKACFLLPKSYIFGSKIKLKGFPKEFAQSKNFNDFENALEGDLKAFKAKIPGRLYKIKSAKNNNSALKLMNGSTRQIRAIYDKRVLIKKSEKFWDTRPVVAQELK